MDLALNNAAVDIIRISKTEVPHDTGNLQSSGYFTKNGLMQYEVGYNRSGQAPYARRWEFETPPGGFNKGRKSHYLSDPVKLITRAENMYHLFREAASRVHI